MELAKVILEMPPVLEERKERDETIEEDPKLSDYDSHPHVFVDISMSVSNRVRLGTLGNSLDYCIILCVLLLATGLLDVWLCKNQCGIIY